MKLHLLNLVCVVLLFSCGNDENKLPTDMVNIPATASEGIDDSDLPVLKFDEESFDFGTITQGEKVDHEFHFTNEGNSDLIISSAYADCGCTVAETPKKPIPPGEGASIKVTFDSSGKSGVSKKKVTVVTNSIPNTKEVHITANIYVPEKK